MSVIWRCHFSNAASSVAHSGYQLLVVKTRTDRIAARQPGLTATLVQTKVARATMHRAGHRDIVEKYVHRRQLFRTRRDNSDYYSIIILWLPLSWNIPASPQRERGQGQSNQACVGHLLCRHGRRLAAGTIRPEWQQRPRVECEDQELAGSAGSAGHAPGVADTSSRQCSEQEQCPDDGTLASVCTVASAVATPRCC